jgi:hypothetical protein
MNGEAIFDLDTDARQLFRERTRTLPLKRLEAPAQRAR